MEAEDGQLHSIYELPDYFRASRVYAYHHRDLTSLPNGMSSIGSLTIYESGLLKVPDDLQAGGGLDVERSRRLSSFGERVIVGGNLCIGGCQSLTALPADLHVEENLYTRWHDMFGDLAVEDEFCDGLTDIPSSVYIGGDIYLDGCRSLQIFPADLKIRKSLNINGTKIEHLPERLIVPGHLYLGGGHLRAFPKVLHVGKNLRVDLHGFGLLLAAIDARHDLVVGGCVYVEGKPVSINLKKYPDDDPQYKKWSEDGRWYSYEPPDDLPAPEPMWTKVPPFTRFPPSD